MKNYAKLNSDSPKNNETKNKEQSEKEPKKDKAKQQNKNHGYSGIYLFLYRISCTWLVTIWFNITPLTIMNHHSCR